MSVSCLSLTLKKEEKRRSTFSRIKSLGSTGLTEVWENRSPGGSPIEKFGSSLSKVLLDVRERARRQKPPTIRLMNSPASGVHLLLLKCHHPASQTGKGRDIHSGFVSV
jgi:hypothetical protein